MVSPGELLRECRRRVGVTQAELAQRADTTQSAIARLEGGRRSPTVRQLTKLLDLLGLDLVLEARERTRGETGETDGTKR